MKIAHYAAVIVAFSAPLAHGEDDSWKAVFSPLPSVTQPNDAAGNAKIALGKRTSRATRATI
jgi:hypothetical protein